MAEYELAIDWSGMDVLYSDVDVKIDAWGDGYPWPIDAVLNWLEWLYNSLTDLLWDHVIHPLEQLWSTVVRPIVQMVQGEFDNIWRNINNVIGSAISGVRGAVDGLYNNLRDLGDWIRGSIADVIHRIGDLPGSLWSDLNRVWGWISDRIADLGNQVWSQLNQVWTWISDRIGDLGNQVWSDLNRVWGWIAGRIGDLGNQVWSQLNQLWTWISDRVGVLWSDIQGSVNWLWSGISERVGRLWGDIQHELVDPLGDWLARIGDRITSIWEWLKDGLSRVARNWVNQQIALVDFYSALGHQLADTAGTWLNWIWARVQDLSGWVWNAINRRFPHTPEDAPAMIAELIGNTATIGLSLFGAKVGGQFVLPHITGLDRSITSAVKEITDFEEINRRWTRPLFDSYIGLPTYYNFNKLFRTRKPSPSELVGLLGEYAITPEQYKSELGYYGIQDKWADLLSELADRPVPLFRLVDMGLYDWADDDFITRELKNSSYNPGSLDYLRNYVKTLAYNEGASRGISSILALHRDGFLTEGQLRDALAPFHYSEATITGYIQAAKWQWTEKEHSEIISELTSQYAKDLIGEDGLRFRLNDLGWAPARIDRYVLLQNVKKVPTPRRPAPSPPKPLYLQPAGQTDVQRLIISYENDLIDRSTFSASLERLEMASDLIEATVDLSDVRKTVADLRAQKPRTPAYDTDAGRLNIRTLVMLYSLQEVSEADLRAALHGLEMPAELVDATVDNAKVEELKKARAKASPFPQFEPNSPKAIIFADTRAAYRRREISADQLGAALVNVGYKPDDARAIVEAETLVRQEAPVPRPEFIPPYASRSPQALLYADSLSAYRQGRIDDTALRDILRRLGYDEGQTAQIIQAETMVRHVPEPEPPSIVPPWPARSPEAVLFTTSRAAYRDNRLTDDELRGILEYLGYTAKQARQIVAAEALVRKPEKEPASA